MNELTPFLYFEFAKSNGMIEPIAFLHPEKIISTRQIHEVLDCIQEVQEWVKKGYYAAGFLSYESAPAFDASLKTKPDHQMPLLWFGLYKEPTYQVMASQGSYSLTEWEPDTNESEYREAIQSIKSAIAKGITYQTNYTIRLHARFQGDAFALFDKMKKAQKANFCAYIHTGEHSILSASPELFFHMKGNHITTRPMKGTVKRGKTFEEDLERANWLYHSEKNRAENVMIVDLLRNDVGAVAETGTVKVDKLFEIEQYPTVHQMTSTVTAKLKKDAELVDVFKAIFPCGSITGAPKASTMDIISQLEKSPREVYCGAIGYITPDQEAIFNVPIRTVVIDHQTGKATYGVGGGITWDSTAEDEFHEVLAKCAFLNREEKAFQLLESLLLDNGEYFLLEEHLNRLKKSATYFQYAVNTDEVEKKLKEFAKTNPSGQWKVRLLLDPDGTFSIEGQPIGKMQSPKKAVLAKRPIHSEHLFLYHKTTNRHIYEQFKPVSEEIFDVLLWNEKRELTEFINGNVVVEIDGKLWTPPVQSGLLAGTFRGHLLKTGRIQEKVLTLDDLKTCSKIWFINSVRKWIEIELVQGE
ncbi:aminodeoxychorismate synthase component I [Ureibacillus terrenus]|uniref:aminodeoxychorismate synthase component I n=1 Tax=Ureibacillus terrenus TaxID=118246 RepID=UPI002E1D238B|nr:aminodeoxychorismate synthase component I [Ureibacillus terrenus]